VSRIGKKPIPVPGGVKVAIAGGKVNLEGPKGKVSQTFRPESKISFNEQKRMIVVEPTGSTAFCRAYHGTTRALIANMVRGVSQGFARALDIVGVGYGAKLQGKNLVLQIGFCHPVTVPVPEGVTVEIPQPTRIQLASPNKQLVGEFAAFIRRIRPPEPYKGKGIRYENEQVVRKAGKAFGTGT
jgi:large subunit ribosomal protein L6